MRRMGIIHKEGRHTEGEEGTCWSKEDGQEEGARTKSFRRDGLDWCKLLRG
jgi:hypothetical protein